MSGPSRVIEVVGAPASGKSTLVGRLAGRRVHPRGSGSRWFVPAEMLLRTPRWPTPLGPGGVPSPRLLAMLVRSPRIAARLTVEGPDGPLPPEWERLWQRGEATVIDDPRGDAAYRAQARRWAERTARLVEAASSAPEGTIPLLAEGVVQRVLSMVGARGTFAAVEPAVALLAPSTLIVHLLVPEEELVARARLRRSEGREPELQRGLDEEQVRRSLRADSEALDVLVGGLERSGVPVLRTAGSGHVEQAVLAAL